MQILVQGQNLNIPTEKLQVIVTTGKPADITSFRIYADGKTKVDDDCIFFNKLKNNDNTISCNIQNNETLTTFTLDLPNIINEASKVAFGLTSNFSNLKELEFIKIEVKQGNATLILCEVDLNNRNELSLILCEIYRHSSDEGAWKFRFISQGFAGGLKPLVEFYGIEVAEENSSTNSTVSEQIQKNKRTNPIKIKYKNGELAIKGAIDIGRLGIFENTKFLSFSDKETTPISLDIDLETVKDYEESENLEFKKVIAEYMRGKEKTDENFCNALVEYCYAIETKFQKNQKLLLDNLLSFLFIEFYATAHPFWEDNPELTIKGKMPKVDDDDDLDEIIYKETSEILGKLHNKFFVEVANDGSVQKPDIEEEIKRLFPMFNLEKFIKSIEPEHLHISEDSISVQFGEPSNTILVGAYMNLDMDFAVSEWDNH